MTVVSPACDCQLQCSHHPDGKCPRFANEKRKLCEACLQASTAERNRLEAEYQERKSYLVENQTGLENGEVTDPELIEIYDQLKRVERQLAVTR